MTKSLAKVAAKRAVGQELLEGLRQLKKGEVGRVITVPSVAHSRERTGLSQAKFASLLGENPPGMEARSSGAVRCCSHPADGGGVAP
jgi:DNA-binding transcriptional regulator YiaG